MSAESALGTADALLEQGVTRCPPGAPSSPVLCVSLAGTRNVVPFPTVIVNSFSPWTLATSLLLAEPPSVPAPLAQVVIEEKIQAPASITSSTTCRWIAVQHRSTCSLLNHAAKPLLEECVWVMFSVVSFAALGCCQTSRPGATWGPPAREDMFHPLPSSCW